MSLHRYVCGPYSGVLALSKDLHNVIASHRGSEMAVSPTLVA